MVFWFFEGVPKETSGMKWVNHGDIFWSIQPISLKSCTFVIQHCETFNWKESINLLLPPKISQLKQDNKKQTSHESSKSSNYPKKGYK